MAITASRAGLGRLTAAERVFFLHIPKTAGSTFVEFFRGRAAGKAGFWYRPEARQRFLSVREYNPQVHRIAGGHFPLHQALAIAGTGCTYLSFVREPVERLVSYYRFAQRTEAQNSTADAARRHDISGFLKFLEAERPRILRNQQSRFLARHAGLEQQLDLTLDEVMDSWEAVDRVVLPAHQCAAAVAAVAQGQGLGAEVKGQLRNQKVSPPSGAGALDERSRQLLLENNRQDLALYELVTANAGS